MPGSLPDSVSEAWVARYNGSGGISLDLATSVVIDPSGNVHVTGLSGGDCATIKYSASGQELWAARYDGAGVSGDWANAIALDDSGNVYVTGYASEPSTGSSDFLTIKYNASGQEQWVVLYNGPGDYYDEANAVVTGNQGDVYITGYSFGLGTTGDYATIKYDAAGQLQWVVRYNGPGTGYDESIALAIDASGNLYVTGYSPGAGTSLDYATIKYDPSGEEQWVARYNGPGTGYDYGYDIAVDDLGNVFVTGLSGGDYGTIKYDASGQEQWVARYDGGSSDYASALALNGSGDVFVTGHSSDPGTSEDYVTIRYNAAGEEQWIARYNGPGNLTDHASALVIDGSGNIYVTGNSTGAGTGNDYATIKYDASGEEQWVARYDAAGSDDRGTAIVLDVSGNLYVTGLSEDTLTNYDFATIKYEPALTGVSDGGGAPTHFSLNQNYPNPFNPTTTFEFSIPSSLFANLSIYNLLGEKVAIVVNEQLSAGTHRLSWNATGQASGVYVYRLQAGGFTETRKLVLLR